MPLARPPPTPLVDPGSRDSSDCEPSPKKNVFAIHQGYSQILPRLYLSGYLAAINEQQLRDMRATHILSILELAPPFPPALVDDLHTMHVCLADDDDADILSHLGATTAFIASALQAENNVVLVHCAMGISRSPAVVCAYLIATEGMTPRDALDFCLSKRDIIDPNFGFRQQLEQFHAARVRAAPPPGAGVLEVLRAMGLSTDERRHSGGGSATGESAASG